MNQLTLLFHKEKPSEISKLQAPLKSILVIPTKPPNYSLCLEQMVNKKFLRYMLDHPWVLLLLTLIITTPLLWWFTHTIVKPITNLQKAANSVALGTYVVVMN